MIVSSHSELRCPECRVLVDIKIDDLPPNVLLMRILGGMKSALSVLNNTIGTEAVSPPGHNHSQSLANPSVLNTNGSNNDHGMSINASSRDHVKRTVPLNSEPIHRSMVKPSDDNLNAMRGSNPSSRQPLQNVPTLNSNSLQTTGTSPPIPHAKALYDFDSKEPG